MPKNLPIIALSQELSSTPDASHYHYPWVNLISLMIARRPLNQQAQILRLVTEAEEPTTVIEAWAAINYYNVGFHQKIKSLTGWDADHVKRRHAELQWEGSRSDMDRHRWPHDWPD